MLMTDAAFLEAMVKVEQAWLAALTAAGAAPPDALATLAGLIGDHDLSGISEAAESVGNPAIPVVRLLRARLVERNPAAARWVHRGLTSQDVVDTALILCIRDAFDAIDKHVREHVSALVDLADKHANTLMVARTLTQHAVPTTFGVKSARWLDGILDAAELMHAARIRLPVQLGGAAGTNAATTELLRGNGIDTPADAADAVARDTAQRLGLQFRRSWHTSRMPLTSAADALVAYTDVLGHIAADVTTLSRPEIAELHEAPAGGRGGSSTMPNKRNPILSILIRRAALAAPMLASTLHLAAGTSVDERPDGAWHMEWDTTRLLVRRTVVAASQASELLTGLEVDAARMAETLQSALPGVLAEQRSMNELITDNRIQSKPHDPARYLGAAPAIVADAVDRGRAYMKESS